MHAAILVVSENWHNRRSASRERSRMVSQPLAPTSFSDLPSKRYDYNCARAIRRNFPPASIVLPCIASGPLLLLSYVTIAESSTRSCWAHFTGTRRMLSGHWRVPIKNKHSRLGLLLEPELVLYFFSLPIFLLCVFIILYCAFRARTNCTCMIRFRISFLSPYHPHSTIPLPTPPPPT